MVWETPQGTKWVSQRGIYTTLSGDAVTNPNPSIIDKGRTDVIKAYATYMHNAKTDQKDKDGNPIYDWSEWNAKKLIWEMGNKRSLTSVRNLMSTFQKDSGYTFGVTLSSGPRTTRTAEQKKKEFEDLYKELNLAELGSLTG